MYRQCKRHHHRRCGTYRNGNNNGNGNGNGGIHLPNTPVTIPPLPTTNIPPVDQVLTLTQATLQCTLDGLVQLTNPAAFQQCLDDYMNPRTAAQRQAARDASARFSLQRVF